MKTFFAFAIVLSAALLAACGKDKFETKPLLEIKDYNSKTITPGETLRIRLNYFDKEGDLSKGTFTYMRIRTNRIPISNPGANDKADTVISILPEFPSKNTAEINIAIDYDFLNEDPVTNDTMYFKFAVVDIKGNKSDTVSSQSIVARQP